jgi:PAS domain S-box-containing protein
MTILILFGIFLLTCFLVILPRLTAKSEKKFRALVEHGEDVILLTTKEGKVIYVSPGIERLTGFSIKDLMGRNIVMIMHPDYINASKDVFKRLLQNPGLSIPGSNRLINKNGGHIDVEGTVSNFLHDKNVRAVVTNFRDITARKLAQEKLASSESRFRAVIENSTDVILMLDKNFKAVYRSPSANRVTGFTDEEILGKDSLAFIHPDDRPFAKDVFAEMMANPEVPLKFACRNLTKSGDYIWVKGYATNFLQNESIQAFVFNFRDITEQKEAKENLIKSEQIYRTIASSIPGSVICLLDTGLRYTLIEGDILEQLGFSREKLLGKKLVDVSEPDAFNNMQLVLEQVMQGEIITRESSYNGYDIISRFIPLKDENDNVYSIMSVSIDITEIKDAHRQTVEFNERLEKKVIERTTQLEAVNKELQQFAYIASHDLQQPLRTVSNYMQVFEEDYVEQLDNNALKYLRSVSRATTRMSKLINSLLDFSKLSHNKKLVYADCNQILKEVIADLNAIVTESNALITVSNMPTLNLFEGEIRQLFQNLILNAIKFQADGNQPVVKIFSEQLNNKWKFSVSDNGIGIDPAHFGRIFDIFQRLDDDINFEGYGIGLSICKKIVQLHHGEIWVESNKGQGSVFNFTIPNLTYD